MFGFDEEKAVKLVSRTRNQQAARWVSASARVRVATMFTAGVGVGVAVGLAGQWVYAPLCGWDVAAVVFTLWVWLAVGRMDSSATAAHATRENPGRAVGDVIVLIAAIANLGGISIALVQANSSQGVAQDMLALLALASVALSWFTVHTLFMLRYAQLYYTGPHGGVNFNQESPPRYLDFAYLAFTIGMTFQVSDTDLEKPEIRATALRHALLSYLFGAVILAVTINLIAGLGTGGRG
jgi:uncharacterized membrane protein